MVTIILCQIRLVAQSCLTLCDPMNRSTPGLPVHHQFPEFTQTHFHRVSDAIQTSHPLSSPSPPAPNPSQHQSLFQESTLCMRWPKYWSFSFNIIPSKEIPGLISFRMDWLDLLAVQGTLQESSPTPQFKSINSSALSLLHSPTVTYQDNSGLLLIEQICESSFLCKFWKSFRRVGCNSSLNV